MTCLNPSLNPLLWPCIFLSRNISLLNFWPNQGERYGRIRMTVSMTLEDNLSFFQSRSLVTFIKTKSLSGSSEVSLTVMRPWNGQWKFGYQYSGSFSKPSRLVNQRSWYFQCYEVRRVEPQFYSSKDGDSAYVFANSQHISFLKKIRVVSCMDESESNKALMAYLIYAISIFISITHEGLAYNHIRVPWACSRGGSNWPSP